MCRFALALVLFLTPFVSVFAENLPSGPGPAPSRLSVPESPNVLGSIGSDLVYTPIAPCRIVDTRLTFAGAILSGTTQNFIGINANNYTSQGGSATNCGTLGVSATALMLTVTAATPSLAGYAVVYNYGAAKPADAISLQYAAGSVTSTSIPTQIPNPQAFADFSIYSQSTSDFLVDIIGYFAPPIATALQCLDTNDAELVVPAAGSGQVFAPACPAGYTATGLNCKSSSYQMPPFYFSAGSCQAVNNSPNSATLRANRTCCRVPGR